MFLPDDERGSSFHPIPGIGLAIRYRLGNGLDPVGKSSIYESEPGRVPSCASQLELGEITVSYTHLTLPTNREV